MLSPPVKLNAKAIGYIAAIPVLLAKQKRTEKRASHPTV